MLHLRIILLSLLAGATLAVGATAAVAFPTMKSLGPVLEAYAAWPDPHWPIAAGAVANVLFRSLDWMALGVAVIALLSLAPPGSRPARGLVGMLCAVSIIGLCAVVAINWAWLRPTMHEHLGAFWTAAGSGDIDAGRAERAAFDRLHPIASWCMYAQLAFTLIGAATSRHRKPTPGSCCV